MQKRLKRFKTKNDSVIKVSLESKSLAIEGFLLDISLSGARVALKNCEKKDIKVAKAAIYTERDKYDIGDVAIKSLDDSNNILPDFVAKMDGGSAAQYEYFVIKTLGNNFPVDQIMKYLNNQNQDSPYDFELQHGRFTMADFYSYNGSDDILEKTNYFQALQESWSDKNSYQYERYRHPSMGKRVTLDRPRPNGEKDYLVFGSNDYLGFASDGDVINANIETTKKYGVGSTGSSLTTGLSEEHAKLNKLLAEMFGKEDSMLFNSGYSANVGILSAICRKGDIVFYDQLSHASIQDALLMVKASGGKCIPFKHNNMEHLEELLIEHRSNYKGCLIVSEGIFSMDGYLARIHDICDLADKYSARTFLDVAHDFGVVGENGLGAAEYYGVIDRVDIIMGTFSKIAGGIGGFCVSSHAVRNYLRMMARSYMFSVSIPPATAAAAHTALKKFWEDKSHLHKLQSNIKYFVKKLQNIGVPIKSDHKSTICPVIVGSEDKLNIMSKVLFDNGVAVTPIVYPAVARSQARFRFTVSAMHEKTDLDYAALVLKLAFAEVELLESQKNLEKPILESIKAS